MSDRARIDHRSVAILGVVTICSYGTWYYAFGVLLDPIRLTESWSESTLAASFSAGTVVIGLGSFSGGRLLDRYGHRTVFLLASILGPGALLLASIAPSVWLFFVASAIGSGAFGALGFYHVTMTAAVRLNPDQPARAIAILTIWGAAASAIYLPMASWLEETTGWRTTTRLLAGAAFVIYSSAAVMLPQGEAVQGGVQPPLTTVLRSMVARPDARRFTIAVGFGGIAMATMLVYQVPTMTAVGLPAATAAAVAGLRGFSQLGGRIPLTPIVKLIGIDQALILAFAAIGVGGALLSFSGTLPTAILFALVAGFGIGAFSPLQGMKAEELFERDTLGATMGFYGSVLVLVGSAGPVLTGFIAEATGDRRWASVVIIASASAAIAAQRQRQ
ncbi:MAG: MFS transporter [Acidimicrobiales bacterium]|nr:MFS transporter [Acidimicrobiales bacterium]